MDALKKEIERLNEIIRQLKNLIAWMEVEK